MNPMKFCPECNNLLYSRADKELNILLDACRTCSYTEKAKGNCVYRNVVGQINQEPLVLRNAYEDPTLPRAKGIQCPLCGYPEVAFFLSNSRSSLARTYACCNPSCGHNWGENRVNLVGD